jgi:hypothetical protein
MNGGTKTKSIMKTKTFLKKLYLLSFSVSLLFTISCRSEQQDTTTENIKGISFNISVENFGELNVKNQANTKSNSVNTDLISREEFTSGPFNVVSELSVDNTALKISPRSFLPGARQFRIVAYDSQTGDYTAQDIGSTNNPTQQLFANVNLVGGKKYTFVTYSLNTNTAPPAAPTTNLNQAKLNLTSLNGEEAGTDLLYAINENVMISGGNTSISVILKHQFSRILISVDNSNATGTPGQPNYVKGGYPLENNNTGGFTGIIPDFHASGNLNMKDATITEGDNAGLAIPNITTTPKTYIINTGKNAAYKSVLIIPSGAIAIGNDINSTSVSININSPNDNGLQPGKSYTLKLKFNSDRYVDGADITENKNNARYAVIGGYQWDRFNLGAAANHPALSDPDTPSAEIHGAKYTYGAYTGQTNSYLSQYDDQNGGTVFGWTANGNYWNTQDPCDTGTGYRIPTKDEYDKLIAVTNNTIVGTYNSYSYGRKLQSKRSDVQLVFPATGYRSTGNNPGIITERGIRVRYWNKSTLFDNTTATTGPHPSIGAAIRCIRKN